MAYGMGVVTTESSGMTDLVEDSHDGLFVIPGDAESLSPAIVRLCRDPELRLRLGSAAQEKMKRFTWKEAAPRTERVFCRATGNNPPAPPLCTLTQPPQPTLPRTGTPK